jgi:colanic acid biosynthesis glycosyl transferase WcaI
MNIAITSQIFPPERHPTGIMVEQLARYLAERGNRVSVITGYPHHPHGRVLDGYIKQMLSLEERAGIQVVRAWHLTSERTGMGSRASVMASQSLSTALGAATLRNVDAVINFGPPLLGPLFSAALARLWSAPLISVIHDLYPDVAVETGALRSAYLIKPARLVEKIVYRASDRLVVLSEGFKRALVRKGVPREKIEIIPVWLERDELTPLPRDNAWRREQGIPAHKRVVLYAGTIGLVSGALMILDVAERLAGSEEILFLMVGEGRVKDEMERQATLRRLTNIKFIPFQPRERLAEVQATADVSLVTLAKGRGYTSVPSKVIGYMAAGRPIAGSVDLDCDTAETILAAGCGFVAGPGDVDGLAGGLRKLLLDRQECERLGRAARAAFEATYAADSVLPAYERILHELSSQSRPAKKLA